MANQNIEFIYIVGDSRSGSTLLQTLLGGSDEFKVAGEVRRLVVEGISHLNCSCGDAVSRCPYWTTVTKGDALSSAIGIADNPFQRKINQVVSLPFFAFNRALPSWLQGRLSDKTQVSASKILSKLTERDKVVVDSSKVPLHFAALRARMGGRLFPVFLYRDGRAIVYSKMRRGKLSVHDALNQWRNSAISMEIVRRLCRRDQHIVVRYEDLCSDPESEINRIRAKVGFSNIKLSPENIDKGDFHFLGGSPGFSETDGLQVQLDDRWKTGMSKDELSYFESKAGWLNRFGGY